MSGDNVDDVREMIMKLEVAEVFDQRAWVQVLMQLSNSPSRRQDAVRRMMTAKQNAKAVVEYSAGVPFQMSAVEV